MTTFDIRPSLASAFVRMWRAWRILVPVILVNLSIQAITVWAPFTYDTGLWAFGSALVSGLALWIAFAFVCAAALAVSHGPVRWSSVLRSVRNNVLRYVVWSLVWGVAVAVGLALFVLPGIIVLFLTPFLALAILDGQPNPLKSNLRAIRTRFWRWLITCALALLVLTIAWFASGFVVFFLRPPLATVPVWLVGGWLVAWFMTAFAMIYRSSAALGGSTSAQA